MLLLPISIGANEAVHAFPNSYYLQWVQSSLIHGKGLYFCVVDISIFMSVNTCEDKSICRYRVYSVNVINSDTDT